MPNRLPAQLPPVPHALVLGCLHLTWLHAHADIVRRVMGMEGDEVGRSGHPAGARWRMTGVRARGRDAQGVQGRPGTCRRGCGHGGQGWGIQQRRGTAGKAVQGREVHEKVGGTFDLNKTVMSQSGQAEKNAQPAALQSGRGVRGQAALREARSTWARRWPRAGWTSCTARSSRQSGGGCARPGGWSAHRT